MVLKIRLVSLTPGFLNWHHIWLVSHKLVSFGVKISWHQHGVQIFLLKVGTNWFGTSLVSSFFQFYAVKKTPGQWKRHSTRILADKMTPGRWQKINTNVVLFIVGQCWCYNTDIWILTPHVQFLKTVGVHQVGAMVQHRKINRANIFKIQLHFLYFWRSGLENFFHKM